jgi:integrase
MSVVNHYHKAIELSGVRPLPIHALRHAHASLLLAKGIPVPAVSKRLGHTSPQITLNVYAHATQDSDQEIADTLDTL